MIDKDEIFMRKALEEAQKAASMDEVPVGAVVVQDDIIIAKGYNQVEMLRDSTAHAEMIALTAAYQHLNSKYALDCTIYITLEPCLMCAGALFWSRVSRVVYGAPDPNMGFHGHSDAKKLLHPKSQIRGGVLESECAQILRDYFEKKR